MPRSRTSCALRGLAGGLALVTVLSACGGGSGGADGLGNGLGTGAPGAGPGTARGGGLAVVAAERVWGDLAQRIGGDRVTVTSILSSPNDDPHEYEASLADSVAVGHARLVIRNGAGYDGFMDRLLASTSGRRPAVVTAAAAAGVAGANPNPHLWFSTDHVSQVARAVASELDRLDPAHASEYAANLGSVLAAEDGVAAVVRQIRQRYAGRAVGWTERVAGYLVADAGLRLGTPATFAQAVEDGNDPSPVDAAAFRAALEHRTVAVLVVNSQVQDAQTAQLSRLAVQHGIPVVGVGEVLPAGESLAGWQLAEARALLEALGG